MNILLVAHELSLGGATLSLLGLIDELEKKYIGKIYVIIPKGEGRLINELRSRKVHIIQSKFFFWNIPNKKNRLINVIRKEIQRILINFNYIQCYLIMRNIKNNNIKIDLVHTNSSILNIGYILAKYLKVPHVWHIREFGKEDFDRSYIVSTKYMKKCFLRAEAIICVSNAIKNKYSNILGNNNKLYKVYNGINKDYILNNKSHFYEDKVNFLIAGRVCEEKGQNEAVQAIEILINKGYKNIKLYIAGDIENNYLTNYIKLKNLESYIVILGRVEKMFNLRKKIDVELVCSKCEAFGRVTVEAMLSSIPVIGSNTGGTIELVSDGFNGYLYKKGQVEDLVNKMEYLIKNKKYIIELGENAYKWSINKFTSEINADNIFEIYNNIINHKC